MVKRTIVLAIALVVASALPAVGDDKVAKSDREKFQGTWKFISMEKNGEKAPVTDQAQTITFEGDKFTVKVGGQVVQAGTQKLDPTKKPKTVDATVTEGEPKGTTMLGIYELDGDTLKACFDEEGKKRPTEFKAPAGSNRFLAVTKREKK